MFVYKMEYKVGGVRGSGVTVTAETITEAISKSDAAMLERIHKEWQSNLPAPSFRLTSVQEFGMVDG